MQSKIILPRSFYEVDDKPDAAFVQRMQAIDPKLLVYWNRFQGKWVIDRYTCDSDHREHSTACPRVNVKLVETEDKSYHPLNDRVLDWLREADMWNRGLDPDKVNRDLDTAKAAYDASRDNDIRMAVRDVIHDDHIYHDSSFPTIFPR